MTATRNGTMVVVFRFDGGFYHGALKVELPNETRVLHRRCVFTVGNG